LGGGTFDVTVCTVKDGVYDILSSTGDTHLGGEDFDMRIVDYFLSEYKYKNPSGMSIDQIKADKALSSSIRDACRSAKINLSTEEYSTMISVDDERTGFQFEKEFLTYKFVELIMDLLQKTITISEECIKLANKKKEDLDIILLSGGSTYIPKVQSMLEEHFGKKPTISDNVDEIVGIGACIYAAVLSSKKDITARDENLRNVFLSDITPFNLGISAGIDRKMAMIIPKK